MLRGADRCIECIVDALLHIAREVYLVKLLLDVDVRVNHYHIPSLLTKWLLLHRLQITVYRVIGIILLL